MGKGEVGPGDMGKGAPAAGGAPASPSETAGPTPDGKEPGKDMMKK
jgi:hypothetical protein